MIVVGIEFVEQLVAGDVGEAKMVFNATGVVFGPVGEQHRDLRVEGIAYADEYRGNAIAAKLRHGTIEARFHRAFTDDDVAALLGAVVVAVPALRGWTATYQGRAITP